MTDGAPVATVPVLHALLDDAHRGRWRDGVLGVRARPVWDGPDQFDHDGTPVRVVPCVSALAVWEALLQRAPGKWLVVLTDRDDDDLGAGIRSHLVWNRLRTPDPWEAVRSRFAASGLDPALTSAPGHRDLAAALLAATPAAGWPPAPGGVLTRDHALSAVAAAHLALGDDGSNVDSADALAWTTRADAASRLADLRQLAGETLTVAVVDWLAGRCGSTAPAIASLLQAGATADVVPLGLVVGLLDIGDADSNAAARQVARDARIRLEPQIGAAALPPDASRRWARESADVVTTLLDTVGTRAEGQRLLARADRLLAGVGATALAERSDLLPGGLTGRLGRLAAALRAAVASVGMQIAIDEALVDVQHADDVERSWIEVVGHRLADKDPRVTTMAAGVRLQRWLAGSAGARDASLAASFARHISADAWVESAINDAAAGVSEPELGAALEAALDVVRRRRDAHDVAFATALARHTADDPSAEAAAIGRRYRDVRHLEDLLPDVVLPLARTTPALLLVVDGMSAGVAAEIVDDVLARPVDGWQEALLAGEDTRTAALAVLPTLTRVSRASLLCGELRTGEQQVEQRGFTELTRAAGLPGAILFHKRPLDESRPGYAVADDVAAAIADVANRPLVTCVLNTVDDALDRSDPGGIDWRVETVKHLGPLLERARLAGRTVVLTADHGHVIERRQGTQRSCPGISSGRSRPDQPPATDGEVRVAGRRVLEHDGSAVLAVDERLRYGPLKAGYHGGASPAEVVVPVVVLVPGAVPEGVDWLRLAPPQQPAWWTANAVAPAQRAALAPAADMLFNLDPTVEVGAELAHRVVSSATFTAQRRIAGRVPVADDQVRQLLAALLAAPDFRLPPARAASTLGVPLGAVRGAVLQVQRLLNVESYPVLHVDVDGETLVLDEQLLREQFEVSP